MDDVMFSYNSANGAESKTALLCFAEFPGGGTGGEVAVYECFLTDWSAVACDRNVFVMVAVVRRPRTMLTRCYWSLVPFTNDVVQPHLPSSWSVPRSQIYSVTSSTDTDILIFVALYQQTRQKISINSPCNSHCVASLAGTPTREA